MRVFSFSIFIIAKNVGVTHIKYQDKSRQYSGSLCFHVRNQKFSTLWKRDDCGRNRCEFAIHGSVTPFPCIRARKFLVLEQSVKSLTIPSIRSKANPNIASYRRKDIKRVTIRIQYNIQPPCLMPGI